MTQSLTSIPAGQPVRKAAQHLRWFMRAFEQHVEQISLETGNRLSVDREKLAQVFLGWKKSFDATKSAGTADKLAYVGFASGLMLRALVEHNPVKLVAKAPHGDAAKPAWFWPEGFLYVSFCLNIRGLVIENDFHGTQNLSENLADMRTWWSFKENVVQDPSLAIAFLDQFAGADPDWEFPGMFRADRIRKIAERRVNEIIGKVD